MSSNARLDLYFGNLNSPSLYRSVFHPVNFPEPIIGIRGSSFATTGKPFIWCPTLQALSIFFTKSVLMCLKGQSLTLPVLEGFKDSPVAPIGRILHKGYYSFIHDIFGFNSSGRSYLQLILATKNTRFRHTGPATITLKSDYLPPSRIHIYLDEKCINNDRKTLEALIRKLKADYTPRSYPCSARKKASRVSSVCEA
jgi:hypothetical protein